MNPLINPGSSLLSTLTCPLCGYRQTEMMPIDYCQWYYDCLGCKAVISPKADDCCVFCSYGSNKCPSKQNCGTSHSGINL